jgi:hypothetical protein
VRVCWDMWECVSVRIRVCGGGWVCVALLGYMRVCLSHVCVSVCVWGGMGGDSGGIYESVFVCARVCVCIHSSKLRTLLACGVLISRCNMRIGVQTVTEVDSILLSLPVMFADGIGMTLHSLSKLMFMSGRPGVVCLELLNSATAIFVSIGDSDTTFNQRANLI